MDRRNFIKRCAQAGIGGYVLAGNPTAQAEALLSNSKLLTRIRPKQQNHFPVLDKFGDKFTFTLVADPQVTTQMEIGSVGGTSAVRYTQMIQEMNAWPVRPAFSIIDGDLVNTPTSTESWDNFMTRTLEMKFLPILVYGNHDGNADTNHFAVFQDKQEICNGTRDYVFSFDCGRWHFVSIPCDIIDRAQEIEIRDWLREDLYKNRNRPTMIFEHEHLLPQGLTQLEWYTYNVPYRRELHDEIARYGNVKYVVCGHVHNGIETSYKTAWTYRGVNYITAPTCTASRPFGEEYEPFEAGLDQMNGDTGGGYYMVFEVDGDDVTVKARLANVGEEYVYPKTFRPYQDEEPLWFKTIFDYPPSATLQNGSFENDFDGWFMPFRYSGDVDPVFFWETSTQRAHEGGKSLHFRIHEGGQPWAQAELLEVYQWLVSPSRPVVKAHYYVDVPSSGGGGYMRIFAYQGNTMRKLFMLDWGASGSEKAQAVNMVKNSFYTCTGGTVVPATFINMGNSKDAMFWTLTDANHQWHELKLNLKQVYDASHGTGTWDLLGITRLHVAVGVWTLPVDGSRNGCWFDDISLAQEQAGDTSAIDGTPLSTGSDVFYTDWSRDSL